MARILIIEDNPINLELMTDLLEAWNHLALVATDGEEGLQLARSERPDLIVCDLQMPGRDGYEVAAALKADPQLRHIPLIAVTAYAMVGDSEKAIAAGFDAHISKPIDAAGFVPALERFLAAGAGTHDATPPIPPQWRAPGQATLLMVDDEEVNQEFKRQLLEPAGYRVLTVASAGEALATLTQQRVDLVVSDVRMPDMSGFALLQRLRTDPRWRTLPFVFLTATARTDGERAHGLALGAARFLLRPIEPLALLAELRAVLDEKAPR